MKQVWGTNSAQQKVDVGLWPAPAWLILLLVLTLAAAGCSKVPGDAAATPTPSSEGAATAAAEKAPFTQASREVADPVVIPSGTPITVRLQSSVSSASSHAGDRFDAVLDQDLTVKGRTIARAGAPVVGRVVAANPSGRLHHPGMIQLSLASVSVNGKSVPLATSSVGAQGGSHRNRNLAMIGGGAGGGALLGGLLGGGKGALIGGLAGAGTGTGVAYATGKKEVGFAAQRSLTFRTTRSVTLN